MVGHYLLAVGLAKLVVNLPPPPNQTPPEPTVERILLFLTTLDLQAFLLLPPTKRLLLYHLALAAPNYEGNNTVTEQLADLFTSPYDPASPLAIYLTSGLFDVTTPHKKHFLKLQ